MVWWGHFYLLPTLVWFFFPNAVKNKADLTSDDPISDAVETTVAEPVLTDCKETKEG